jgi:hypothetical protein
MHGPEEVGQLVFRSGQSMGASNKQGYGIFINTG